MTSPSQSETYPLTWEPFQEASRRSSYQFADPVQDQVHDLLANGVMASGIIIGCIFLPGDQLLWVEELPVGPGAHFIYQKKPVF